MRDARLVDRVLAATAPFNALPPEARRALAQRVRLILVTRGSAAMRRGEPLAGLFAVARGSIKISWRNADGAERVIRFVGPRDTFGEAGALLQRPAPADALAIADSLLAVVAADSVRALMLHNVRFADAMARLLAQRILELFSELEATALRPAEERLAAYLLSLRHPSRSGSGGWTARLPATKTLVAARLGVKKETLSRLLRQLARRGLINVAQSDIAILDSRGLAEVAR